MGRRTKSFPGSDAGSLSPRSGERSYLLAAGDDSRGAVAVGQDEFLPIRRIAGRVAHPADGGKLTEQRIGRVGNAARYSPDGKKLVLANGDGTARVIPSGQ